MAPKRRLVLEGKQSSSVPPQFERESSIAFTLQWVSKPDNVLPRLWHIHPADKWQKYKTENPSAKCSSESVQSAPVFLAWVKPCFARPLPPFFPVWFPLDQANFSLSKMMFANLKSIEHPSEDWWQFCTGVTLVVFLKHEKNELSTTQIWRNGDTFQAMNTSQDKASGSFGCKSQFWFWVRQRW